MRCNRDADFRCFGLHLPLHLAAPEFWDICPAAAAAFYIHPGLGATGLPGETHQLPHPPPPFEKLGADGRRWGGGDPVLFIRLQLPRLCRLDSRGLSVAGGPALAPGAPGHQGVGPGNDKNGFLGSPPGD